MTPIEVLSLGACLLRGPINVLLERHCIADGSALQQNHVRGGYRGYYYTLDEAIQALDFYRGDRQVPKQLRKYCALNPDWEGRAGDVELYGTSDVALVEINSLVRFGYGPYSLSRAEINDEILVPLANMSEELHLLGNDWYYGVINYKEEAVAASAGKLAAAISDEFPDAELARAIFREVRPRRRDFKELVEGLALLKDSVGAPLGLVTYTYNYLPDGRAMPWPPNLVEQTVKAARQLDLPVFKPNEVVARYGVQRAVVGPGPHYTEEFYPVLADALFPFITEVIEHPTRATKLAGNRWASRLSALWSMAGKAPNPTHGTG
jgi:hypothetical protein